MTSTPSQFRQKKLTTITLGKRSFKYNIIGESFQFTFGVKPTKKGWSSGYIDRRKRPKVLANSGGKGNE